MAPHRVAPAVANAGALGGVGLVDLDAQAGVAGNLEVAVLVVQCQGNVVGFGHRGDLARLHRFSSEMAGSRNWQ
ncbi:hypothetical protein D3C81_2187400 [compost metagenome]